MADDMWEDAIDEAFRKQKEDDDLIYLSKLDLLDWANESAQAILDQEGEEPHEIDFKFASKRVFVDGPLRVVPEDGAEPYYITHVIHQYDDKGEIIDVEEGDVIDDYQDFDFDHFDESASDDPDDRA